MVQEKNKRIKKNNYNIVNIVASGRIANKLNLTKILGESDFTRKEYDPEMYPGLLAKTEKPRAHITLYQNGKFIIAGVTSTSQLEKVYNMMKNNLKDIGEL